MTKISITMPDEMGKYIQSAMKARQFENTSEYFRHLVRQDQERESKIAELRNMLDEAEASGISDKKVPDIMRDVEERLRKNGRLPTN
ncbi:MAG: type II toxin-antitoxin system ParD family antitoxin [Nitrospinae bacterium]|nr:type II toxin-antitoxin system ParD family antitoxin [Nitrospinota bacterium]